MDLDDGTAVEVVLLGSVEVRANGQAVPITSPQQRLVLAILALEANRLVATARLIDLLWPASPPASANNAVQVCVSRLRRALADAEIAPSDLAVVGRDNGYLLRTEPERVDVHRFRRLLKQAGEVPELEARIQLLERAVSLWSGPALTGVGTDLVRGQLGRGLEEARLIATEDLLEDRLGLGQHRDVLDVLADLVAANPVRERLVKQLMLALHRCGRSSAALDLYRETKLRLADLAGLDPSKNLQDLEVAILRDDPRLGPAAPASVTDTVGSHQGPAPTRRPVPAQLPAAVPLVGRTRELADLTLALHLTSTLPPAGSHTLRVALITGVAGIGKTALAVYWAHRVADHFPDGQLYVDLRGCGPARGPASPDEALRDMLDALGVPPESMPISVESKSGLLRSLMDGQRMVLVLDNAASADQVRPLLPGRSRSVVLITSRYRLAGLVAGEAAYPVALVPLTREASQMLFLDRIGRPSGGDGDPSAVDGILDRCGGLPLALAMVAARAAVHPELSLADLAAALRSHAGGLDGFADLATDVGEVFSWSYRALSPETARLFRLAALHPGTTFSAAAAASLAGQPLVQVEAALAELVQTHLLTQVRRHRYGFHDQIRFYAIELTRTSDSTSDRRTAVVRLLDHYAHTAFAADRLFNAYSRSYQDPPPASPGVTPEVIVGREQAYMWFQRERDNLVAAVELADQSSLGGHVRSLARSMVSGLGLRGDWSTLATVQQTAVATAQRLADRPGEALARRFLGRAYTRLGALPAAQEQLEEALAGYESLADRTGQGHTLLDLGWLHYHQGHYADTIRTDEQALAIFSADGDTLAEAIALNATGYCLALLGQYQTALRRCERSLVAFQAVGDRHGQADTLDSIAYCHLQLGDSGRAVACYDLALAAYREVGDRYHEADVLDHLADAHRASGRHDLAHEVRAQAVGILDDLNHPDAAQVRARWAHAAAEVPDRAR